MGDKEVALSCRLRLTPTDRRTFVQRSFIAYLDEADKLALCSLPKNIELGRFLINTLHIKIHYQKPYRYKRNK